MLNTDKPLPPAIFVTGTDTDCGKTFTACALICALKNHGYRVAAMKPVASGSEKKKDGVLVNEDVEALKRYVNVSLPDEVINPYIFEAAISPHFAAEQTNVVIDSERISRAFNQCSAAADIVIVEGAGGWRVPLAGDFYISSLVQELGIPVVLVSGLKLGCINHTLLTTEAIQRDGVELLAWAANSVDPAYLNKEATIALLNRSVQAPLIAEFAWQPHRRPTSGGTFDALAGPGLGPDPERAAEAVNLSLFGRT